jgi:general secretion pathway protein G
MANDLSTRRERVAPVKAAGGFTLIELLVVIGIIAILAALLMPVLGKVKREAQLSQCTSNIRQISHAFQFYLQDHNNRLMQRYYYGTGYGYDQLLIPYLDAGTTVETSSIAKKIFTCPSQKEVDYPAQPGYGMNWYYDNQMVTLVDRPANTVLLAETLGGGVGSHRADPTNTEGSIGQLDDTRHDGRANYLFFDGHISFMLYQDTLTPENLWGTDYGEHGVATPAGGGNTENQGTEQGN